MELLAGVRPKRVTWTSRQRERPEYQTLLALELPVPNLPDPYDASISKRSWEKLCLVFYDQLRELVEAIPWR